MLSPTQIYDFYTKGFFIIEGLFDEADLGPVAEGFDRLAEMAAKLRSRSAAGEQGREQGDDQEAAIEDFDHEGSRFYLKGERILRVVWACGLAEQMDRIGLAPQLLGRVRQLLGCQQLIQIICQTHFKLPGDKVAFPWHQDAENRKLGTSYWRDVTGQGSYVQTALAVDDMDADNGPLLFVPYSTRFGCLGFRKGVDPSPYFDAKDVKTLLMKKGSVAFFHPMVIHGSEPNQSARSRRVLINGYCPPGANSFSYPGCGTGRVIDG